MTKIYLEGAESTGKSTLAPQLAYKFGAEYLPEYGRLYLETHWGNFGLKDIETIARTQVLLENAYERAGYELLFIDVSLINTKHWFLEVYGHCPQWVYNEIENYTNSFFLLCDTDIEWQPDEVRSNPDKKRQILQQKYLNDLLKYNIPFEKISGQYDARLENAYYVVKKYLQQISLLY